MQTTEIYEKLLKYLLPAELSTYFEIVNIEELGDSLHIYLDERAILPDGYSAESLVPNGFYEESIIHDFPIRDKGVYWHVRRRRWLDKVTHKSVSKDWDLVAQGTRYSKEFAAFLKGMLGEISHYGSLT
jgi:hypothetical protein